MASSYSMLIWTVLDAGLDTLLVPSTNQTPFISSTLLPTGPYTLLPSSSTVFLLPSSILTARRLEDPLCRGHAAFRERRTRGYAWCTPWDPRSWPGRYMIKVVLPRDSLRKWAL